MSDATDEVEGSSAFWNGDCTTFITGRVLTCFTKLAAGTKFDQLFRTENNLAALTAFYSEKNVKCLIVPESLKIAFMDSMPAKLPKTKVLALLKVTDKINKDNISRSLVSMELGGSPSFMQLEQLLNKVLLPIISSIHHQKKWGEVATQEIMQRFLSFLVSSNILCGQIKGETRLPVPPFQNSAADSGFTDLKKVSFLEGAIMTWSKQIKNVLKQDPEAQLKKGLHPLPNVEIQFWKRKAVSLNSIFDQLKSDRIQRVLVALDLAKSTYCSTFATLCKEVFNARREANDNVKYLRTLEPFLERIENTSSFAVLAHEFKPLFYVISLIWKHSTHYNTPARLVVLVREFCNSLIALAYRELPGSQLFTLIENNEANAVIELLETILFVTGFFKSTFFEYKEKVAAECPENPWRIQSNAIFTRLDIFIERCYDILEIVETIVQFSKISKIEIGGTKGKVLTSSIRQIQVDFQSTIKKLKEGGFDIMDLDAGPFDAAHAEFRKSVKELDLRLAAVVSIALEDCSTLYGKLQLLDSFEGGLLDRPIIQDELESRKVELVYAFRRDLRFVQEAFITHRDDPPKETTRNLPPVSGSLIWCRGLLSRAEIPMTKLQKLDRTILDREEAKEVAKIQSDIVISLKEFETTKIEVWGQEVSLSSDKKLHLPLIVRSQESGTLRTNFDPTLVRLLREVKYFLLLELKVAKVALDVFDSAETFRSWTGNLDLIVNMYNEVLGLLLPVERPLLAPYLNKFDQVAHRAISDLHWRSDGVDAFIADAMKEVTSVHSIMRKMKQNFASIQEILAKWAAPLMQRKTKPVDKEDFEREFNSTKSIRYTEMRDANRKIHELVGESFASLQVRKSSHEWQGYLSFVDNIVVEGLVVSLASSLEYLIGQIEPNVVKNHGKLPMLEIKLQLDDSVGVLFKPIMNRCPEKNGVLDLIDGIIESVLNISSLINQLKTDETYIEEIRANKKIISLRSQATEIVAETQRECEELKDKFDAYSFLWKTNVPSYFTEFCKDAVIVSVHGTVNLDLKKFDDAIQYYTQIQKDVSKFKSPVDMGWLRINIIPVKQQISMHAAKWIRLFTSYMLEFTLGKLTEHHAFINLVAKRLEQTIEDGPNQKQSLMDSMSIIRDVKKKVDSITETFEPQNECLQILRRHGVDVMGPTINGRSLQDFLEEAPIVWEAVVKKTFKKKEDILPMQNASVDDLKFELDRFSSFIREFRGEFRTNAPFRFSGSIIDAQKKLDIYNSKLREIEDQVSHFHELEELFELQQTNYIEIGETHLDIKYLRILWEFKNTVDQAFEEWKKTLWNDVDTDSIEEKNKKLRKQLKDKGNAFSTMKGWQVYKDIEETIDVMATVLPLINDLHSEAIRPRHWVDLAKVCSVNIVDPTDPYFSLEDMLNLQLHRHKETIEDIVETAIKELKIERKLEEIEKIWGDMTLDYVPHKDTDLFLPKLSETLVEAIESHQMELQGIFGMGKFMEYFKDRVIYWQSLLRAVDETLQLWMSVSKSWASLETIFMSSEDIKSQLAEDAARFEGIDTDFRGLMKNSSLQSNCIAVCSVEGRFEALKGMLLRLELCQKSLNEYLDIKKKVFPRFYFVSSVALLDMLANGTNPPKIMCYLGDCFDALADLRFVKTETGQSNKAVDGMIAKDGEKVALSDVFVMEGEVEAYLNRLTSVMQHSLKLVLSDAIEKAVSWELETPRHEWLFSYPAQLCITGTQIYWTDETQLALEEYESGQEDVVKRYLQVCNTRLSALIDLVLGELAEADRTKIISLITMDVHSRDVVERMVSQKVEGPSAFAWQQQLRFEWDQSSMDVDVKICDFACKYFYEWVGNTGRLVITPLTDRCYITLTTGLKLFLGGAPAGPAGTGKTETTKDLARALAIPCYVFNCSSQMNFQSMADIFRGLAQTGAWGCFDEFNRISIEVLSVIATQVKTVQDAIRKYSRPENRQPEFQPLPAGTPPTKVGYFDFMGDTISLIPSCGFWITMNPGYAGRTELPENLKALFRSCAMIRPDMKLIQENMLMAEGFQMARPLSVKFFTLYELSSALLSKQPHYDWGLRAVKSVLRVAGSMKRANPNLDESQVLMRALRDFNLPKLPIHDIPIFLRLINDLFMGLMVDSTVDDVLKAKIIRVAKEQGLQYDEMFVNKTCSFQVLLDVRHSVMLLGPTGCGKTTIWKTLQAAYNLDKPKKVCVAETVNPKALTGDQLYGYMTLAKDWKDGALSIIMRGMSKNFADRGFHEHQAAKWVVLDGDIDAEWIESMNTVMDDNKVLTLVSNERVPLSPSMRMVFEINSLKNATPATVSRAGILFINEVDIGWRPLMETWVQHRKSAAERNYLPSLFERYIETLQEMTRRGYKEVTNIRIINKVSTIIYLLEGLLSSIPEDKLTADSVEMVFAFCAMWAFGGPMVVEKALDHRKKFSEEFCSAFGGKIPKEGLCFDYFYNIQSGEFVHWQTEVPKYVPVKIGNKPGEAPFNSIFVETVESVRLMHLLNKLARNGRQVMFAGNTGTGKTEIIKRYLNGLDKAADGIITKSIVMSYYTSADTLQQEIDVYIDKRSGTFFGPPMGKKMVFFIDDMNLPYIETYGTQNSIALLTQHLQHGSIFDRSDLGMRKHLVDIQYIAAMNPTAGSFEICERCQRHFATFAVSMPSHADLTNIFAAVFGGHLETFQPVIQDLTGKIVNAAIQIHEAVSSKFLPSAVKFMYNWNMRELANVFQGCCNATNQFYIKPEMMIRLFIHEAERVYCDRLVSEQEIEAFDILFKDIVKKTFLSQPLEDLFSSPLVYTNFINAACDGAYLPIPSMEKLKAVLDAKLIEYNESNAMMDLVLFEQAMLHITRISRIIQNPGGNAMLIGVGGSGKQSLTRLAAFISNFEVKQLIITSNFTVEDLKENLRNMFLSAGVKGNPIVFLITDSQISDEKFLVYINSMLTTGWIADLFPKEEIDNFLGAIANDAKTSGIADTFEARMSYFISRIRRNLHLVLAFSPVGEVFRVRARRFPGLVNCTGIDQFHPWPREALVSVAERFLRDIDIQGPEDTKNRLSIHMAEEHTSVTRISQYYLETQRRYNYVTPKSYLELISFFKYLLGRKRGDLQRLIDRLDVGLATLRKTAIDVAELQKNLNITLAKVEEKKKDTDILIGEMELQKADAKTQQDAAESEAQKANEESERAMKIEAEAEEELSRAKPAMEAAAAAVNCLSKPMLTELKNLSKPPAGVDKVTNACLILIEKEYNTKKQTWERAKKMMQNVDAFKNKLAEFRGETITEQEIGLLQEYVSDEIFTPEKMLTKSAAAANCCTWVVNIYAHNRIYVKVKPLMDMLEEARAKKAAALANLEAAQKNVEEVQEKLKLLTEKFEAAVAEKKEVEFQAQILMNRADLAQRLVGGLASENVRWSSEIENLKKSSLTLTGDCMLAAGFVSYVGAFDQELRQELWKKQWTADLIDRKISMTENSDPLSVLTNKKNTAKMISEGLPSDRVSIENGSIVTNSKRWPLIIDPQNQGIKWLKRREEGNVSIIQLTQKDWVKIMQKAITNGNCIIIENLGSEIDAILDPVLSRSIYKKGRSLFLRFGGEEVEYHMAFQLYLQTKLSNPRYRPETLAQCTLVNFIATEKGLEDQLLARVVEMERKDLEVTARELSRAEVAYQMQLVTLEDDLLERLANAPDDILGDVALIEGMEATKKTVTEINEAVETGRNTQIEVENAREAYRPQASEGAMLYFLLTKLCYIEHMYQYSLDSFIAFFEKSVRRAEPRDNLSDRVKSLTDSLRMTIFSWVSRGLFERHKLIFLSQLTFNLLKRGVIGDGDWNETHFQFLLRDQSKSSEPNPLPWLPNSAWSRVLALDDIEGFSKFKSDLVEASPRFCEWYNSLAAENEKLPLDWAGLDKTPFQKMLIVRCLRPDRLTSALSNFIRNILPNGSKYIDCDSTLNSLEILDFCLQESTPGTPLYFILSPGANVVRDLDIMAAKYGFQKGSTYHNVSMGQGQDVVAMASLKMAHQNGHWVILNNIHLMPKWAIELEKILDQFASEGSHEKFRLFLTSDPSDAIPIGILNRCIKITNEPPAGLKANLKRAWCFFSKEYIEESDSRTKSILFGLCFFHSIMMERKTFGTMGFNMRYPFSIGDLRDSAASLQNYMDNSSGGKIPWQDLKYIFGEIMYGGHIVNDFDRIVANEYLNFYMKDELLDETEMYPFAQDEKSSFISPTPTTFEKYIDHIQHNMGPDTPVAFGLHSNAEIDVRTQQSSSLFKTLLELQPQEAINGDGVATPQQIAEAVATDISEKISEKMFDVEEIARNLDEIGPFQNVFLQEMDVMNTLLTEIKRSLKELQLGFAGELTMSDAMENLMTALYMNKVPASWAKRAWPSARPLASWMSNFLDRLAQLEEWMNNPSEIPKVTWISGLVNPTSFLTAICQVAAQKNRWELDKLVTLTEVTKKMSIDEVDAPSRDGAYITGLSLQGARWDVNGCQLEKSHPKEMFCAMPIINVRAVTKEKASVGGIYQCPVYLTETRGPTWYFNAQLKTKSPPARWVLAGVALIADVS